MGVTILIRVRSGLFGFQIFGVKDFSPIRIFLNFDPGSVRIFAG